MPKMCHWQLRLQLIEAAAWPAMAPGGLLQLSMVPSSPNLETGS